MVSLARLRSKAAWCGWMLRYWVLDKYRLQVFSAALAIALSAAAALVLEVWS